MCDVSRPAGAIATASMMISPTPPSRTRRLVGDEVVGRQVVVHERRLVRGRDDAARDLDRADLERAEEVLERHATVLVTRSQAFGAMRLVSRPSRSWVKSSFAPSRRSISSSRYQLSTIASGLQTIPGTLRSRILLSR